MANRNLRPCGRARGRPRQFDEAEVVQALLETFWKKGFSATSLDDLSRATGLVRPSLYGAFGSKGAMYIRAMDAFLDVLKPLREQMEREQDTGAALDAFFRHMLDVYFGDPTGAQLGCFLVGTALSEAPDNPEIRAALAERLTRFTGFLRSTLTVRAPEAAPEDVAFAAEQAAATMHSIAVRARAGESRDPLSFFAARSAQSIAAVLSGSGAPQP